MSSSFQQVLQAALRLPPAEQMQLREALEDAELLFEGGSNSQRVSGLNRNDPRILVDPELTLPEDYLGELPVNER